MPRHDSWENLCSVSGCDRKSRSPKGKYCETHYYRLRRNGTLETVRTVNPDYCTVPGCDKAVHASAMCQRHYLRVKKRGNPHYEFNSKSADNSHWTGEDASYRAVHQRVKMAKGPARLYECVDCGLPARQWSYDRRGGKITDRQPYETDIERYVPRCVSCHKQFDLTALGRRSA